MIREYECSCGEQVEAVSYLIGRDEDGLPVWDVVLPGGHEDHELEEASWKQPVSS